MALLQDGMKEGKEMDIACSCIAERVRQHHTNADAGSCVLDFNVERDLWGVPHLLSTVFGSLDAGVKRTLDGATKLNWEAGSGCPKKDMKSKHLKKMKEEVLPLLHKIVRGRGTVESTADSTKVRQLLEGSLEKHFGFTAARNVADADLETAKSKASFHDRARAVIDVMRGTKPTADELTTIGSYVSSTCPGEFAPHSEWKQYSVDLGVKDIRKINTCGRPARNGTLSIRTSEKRRRQDRRSRWARAWPSQPVPVRCWTAMTRLGASTNETHALHSMRDRDPGRARTGENIKFKAGAGQSHRGGSSRGPGKVQDVKGHQQAVPVECGT